MNRERVGHQLVEAKVISSENLNKALAIQQGEGGRLGSIFVRMGVLFGTHTFGIFEPALWSSYGRTFHLFH